MTTINNDEVQRIYGIIKRLDPTHTENIVAKAYSACGCRDAIQAEKRYGSGGQYLSMEAAVAIAVILAERMLPHAEISAGAEHCNVSMGHSGAASACMDIRPSSDRRTRADGSMRVDFAPVLSVGHGGRQGTITAARVLMRQLQQVCEWAEAVTEALQGESIALIMEAEKGVGV